MSLLDELVALEQELHTFEARSNQARLEALLHPEFEEIGRSGRRYDRDTTIAALLSETAALGLRADRFRLSELGPGLVLLVYRTHTASDATVDGWTWRSSIWTRSGDGWQLRFHQGTPSTAS